MFDKLYRKSKLYFSLVMIALYVVFSSVFDALSETVGNGKIFTALFLCIFSIFIFIWLKNRGLLKEYGICKFSANKKKYLYFIPLIVLITVNLWCGVKLNFSIYETVFYILSMLFVGFVEEIIFRGFLFKSLLKNGVKSAIIISSVTFGIGHIVNLLNGADFIPTLLQILYAVAIGFLFTVFFYKSKCLIPCILTHSIFNSLSAFGVKVNIATSLLISLILCVIPIFYSIWILKNCTD